MEYNRGGKSLKVGKIGKLSILRQMVLYPGDTLKTGLKGTFRLGPLRQQTSAYLDVRLEAFATPIRWLQTNFPDYLQEGVSTAKTIDTHPKPIGGTDVGRSSELGIGMIDHAFCKWFIQAPIKIWNEYFRWAEDAKLDVTTPTYAMYADFGLTLVNLESHATRMHTAPVFDASEYQVASSTVLDVRDLELFQSRFAQAAKTDWSSQDRYKVFMQDIFNAKGSPEVDQIPTKLKGGSTISVQPRDVYATDSAGLGELMSLSNFTIDHNWAPYTAPEHVVITFVLAPRFIPILEDAPAPGIYPEETTYSIYSGDPNIVHKPVTVASREIDQGGDGTTIGYLPHFWQLRGPWNHVDRTIRLLDSFPLLDGQPLTAAGYRNASLINPAFRSEQLRQWFGDLNFRCMVDSRIPAAGVSILAGSDTKGGLKGNHPHGGYLV